MCAHLCVHVWECARTCAPVSRDREGERERKRKPRFRFALPPFRSQQVPLPWGPETTLELSALHRPILKKQTGFPENSSEPPPQETSWTAHFTTLRMLMDTHFLLRHHFLPPPQEAVSHWPLTFTRTPLFDRFVTTTSSSRSLRTLGAPVCCLEASAPCLRGPLLPRRAGEDEVTVGRASSRWD